MKGRAWKLNLRNLSLLQRYSLDYGVPLLIENVPGPTPYLLTTVADFDLFFIEQEHKMNMVLDIAHANLQGEVYEFLRKYGNRVEHIHVSDNNGREDGHLSIGEGTINWPRVMDAVKETSFSGWVVIESYNDMIFSLNYLKSLIMEEESQAP
jgi:sugar phosphate isomerase/epimerase